MREMAKKDNAVVLESNYKPQMEQQVYRLLDVHLCCGIHVAYYYVTGCLFALL